MAETVIQNNGIPAALEVYKRVLPKPKQGTGDQLSANRVLISACFASWILDKLDERAGVLGMSFWGSAVFMAIYMRSFGYAPGYRDFGEMITGA